MPTSSTYPSIPIPQNTIDSVYQSVLSIRQTVQLLIVNSQQITNQTITQASQIFSKKSDHADVTDTLNNSLTTVNKAITNVAQSLGTLQSNVATLQGQVSALQVQILALQNQMSIINNGISTINSTLTSLQNQINAIDSKLINYLLLTGGIMTGDLSFKEPSNVNAIVGRDATNIRWTVHFGDNNDEFAIIDAAGVPLFWCKQDGSIHVASALVVGAHP